jgi:PmbA protein
MRLSQIKEVVKESAKGFEWELFFLNRRNLKISTENGNFEKISTAQDYALAIRLLKDKKIGFAYTTCVEPSAVKNLVRELKEITQILPPDGGNLFQNTPRESTVKAPFDGKGVNLSVDEKIEMVTTFERNLMKLHPYVIGTRETSLSETLYGVEFSNSFGVEFSYEGSVYWLITSVLAQSPKGDRTVSWGYKASPYLAGLKWEDLAQELVQRTVDTLDPQPLESKAMPVIFHRSAFAQLLEEFSPIFSGESAVKGKTPLLGRENSEIAAEGFTLIDDGTLEGGISTHPYDDEGVPQQRTVLVEKGIFKGFYHSLSTAVKMGCQPTGNGFRASVASPPRADISNFYLQPGEGEFKELLEREEEVLVVYELMGLHTADSVSGDFSLGVSGALYRNGKRVSAVRGVTVAGNFLNLIKDISAIGGDLEFYSNVGSPSVLVKNITVGGK